MTLPLSYNCGIVLERNLSWSIVKKLPEIGKVVAGYLVYSLIPAPHHLPHHIKNERSLTDQLFFPAALLYFS